MSSLAAHDLASMIKVCGAVLAVVMLLNTGTYLVIAEHVNR